MRRSASLLLVAGALAGACAGQSNDSRQRTSDGDATGGAGGALVTTTGGAGGSTSAAGAAGCPSKGCVPASTGGAGGAERGTGGLGGADGGITANGGTPGSGGRAIDGGVRACRLDLCTISSNCCASDGTCGSDSGEGCVSNGFRPPACEVTVDVVTATAGGKFAPRNVAAIWVVQTPSGVFEKTLSTWGGPSLPRAVSWETASGGNRVDAVTGATRSAHGPLTAHWDCTDASEAVVPDGTYEVCIMFTEENCIAQMPSSCTASPEECAEFTKGPSESTARIPDTKTFFSFVIHYR